MIQSQLSEKQFKTLEEEFKKYHDINRIITAIIVADNFKEEDVNDWIRGTREHTQTALTDMIKVENNKRSLLWSIKREAMKETHDESPEYLKQFIDLYFWGERKDYTWSQIRDAEHISKNTVYRWKSNVIERYAKKVGFII